MYQQAIGAQHMRTSEDTVPELPGPYLAVPPFYVKAFPEYLRAAGYFTSNRVKTDYQFGMPFTIWDDLGQTAHWRNRPDPSQPFFSVFNLEVTHESRAFRAARAQGQAARHRPAAIQVPPYYPDTPLVREELARLYDNIADMDAQVGEILTPARGGWPGGQHRSSSIGAITATACRAPSGRSTIRACACR